jgi:hypothetical protein
MIIGGFTLMIGGFILTGGTGVGLFTKMRIGGPTGTRCNPGTDVAEGAASCATSVGTAVGTIGVGGATIDANVSGIQVGVVTVLDIHAKPPVPAANSIYHHVPSVLLPATLAEPPCGSEPIMLYTCPGPLRMFATTEVVTVGLHASVVGEGVSEKTGAMEVNVAVGVAVSFSVALWVGGAPPGILQASAASVMKKIDSIIFLVFIDIMIFSSRRFKYHYIWS